PDGEGRVGQRGGTGETKPKPQRVVQRGDRQRQQQRNSTVDDDEPQERKRRQAVAQPLAVIIAVSRSPWPSCPPGTCWPRRSARPSRSPGCLERAAVRGTPPRRACPPCASSRRAPGARRRRGTGSGPRRCTGTPPTAAPPPDGVRPC